jgi:hypothetical protein
MAPSSQKDLGKLGKEAFSSLSELQLTKKKASSTTMLLLVQNGSGNNCVPVPVQNGSGNNENCIDSNQAARKYKGCVFTTRSTRPLLCLEPPKTKAIVHSAHQYYYWRSAAWMLLIDHNCKKNMSCHVWFWCSLPCLISTYNTSPYILYKDIRIIYCVRWSCMKACAIKYLEISFWELINNYCCCLCFQSWLN